MTIWQVSTLTKWHSSLNVQLAHALGSVITKAISSMDTNGFLDHQRFIALSCFAIVTIERSVSKVSSLLCTCICISSHLSQIKSVKFCRILRYFPLIGSIVNLCMKLGIKCFNCVNSGCISPPTTAYFAYCTSFIFVKANFCNDKKVK